MMKKRTSKISTNNNNTKKNKEKIDIELSKVTMTLINEYELSFNGVDLHMQLQQ
jgi:hypothetical protein